MMSMKSVACFVPRLPRSLFPDVEVVVKMSLLTILDMKNANRAQKFIFQSSTKNRMTHFNIFVLVKRHRDN